MLDEQLKDQRKRLEAAINRALTESPQVGEAIQGIRDAGYDVFLIIEATIGFNKRHDGVPSEVTSVRLDLTAQDERFLRSLKIIPE